METANVSVGLKLVSVINSQFEGVRLFGTILPKQMAKYQKKDNQLSVIYEFVAGNRKPKLSEINCIRSKPIRYLLLQYDRLSLIQGALHHQTFQDDDEIQQLILLSILRGDVLKLLHDDIGHQGLQCVLDLLCQKVYWRTMYVDANCWLCNCQRCIVAKGDYSEPKILQGSLVFNQPLELLCIDFTKVDVSKGGKENILVLTDAFSKYSKAFVTSNQKSLTVTKLLVEKWFSVFGIPSRLHSNQGRFFDNEIIAHLCWMYGIRQSTTTPYNPHGNLQCERFNRTLFGLMHSFHQEQSLIGLFISLPWSMRIMLPHMALLVSSRMSSCSNARIQCHATIG